MRIKHRWLVIGLAALLAGTAACEDKRANEEASEAEEERQRQAKKEKKQAKSAQAIKEVDRLIAAYKVGGEAAFVASITKVGKDALPPLERAYRQALAKERSADAAFEAKTYANAADRAVERSSSGVMDAQSLTKAIVNATVTLGPKGCSLANKFLKETSATCSDKPRRHSPRDRCAAEKGRISWALKTCS